VSDAHFLARAYAAFADDPAPAADFLAGLTVAPAPVLLDVGTGPGLLLKALTERGWQAHGLEPHPAFVAYARTLGAASVRCGGFADLTAEARYDVVSGVGSPLAYLPDFRARRAALCAVWRALVPGGVAVMEVWNMPRVLRYYAPPHPITTQLDGLTLTLTRRHSFDDHRAAFTQHETYTREDGMQATLTHTLTMITIPEVLALFAEAGFTAVATYEGLTAQAAGPVRGSRGVIVGVRP
jgi:SAM-dependent methyltransferase